MKIIHIVLKVLLSLLLVMPILGVLGVFPAPTRDLYQTDMAFAFIQILMDSGYINYMMAIVQLAALAALWTKREGLAALLLAPITVNVVGFHAFLDGGLLKAGSVMALILLALNVYFLYTSREQYRSLLRM